MAISFSPNNGFSCSVYYDVIIGMIVPYSHKFALAQVPVLYPYKDVVLRLYPLRLRDALDMDMWLQARFVKEYQNNIALIEDKELRDEFVKTLGQTIGRISLQNNNGYQLLWNNIDALCHFIYLLTRGEWSEDRLSDLFFGEGLTSEVLDTILEMRIAVWCDLPEIPKLNIVEKKPRYEHTEEELVARIYHTMATKYNWTYEQVLDLTEYQAFWYSYLFPEEREHYEEMDEMAHKTESASSRPANDVPRKPGTIHFNSPDEYERWKAKRAQENINR